MQGCEPVNIDTPALAHPMYTAEAVATQGSLAKLNGRRHTYFCGSYFGYGFHEDALRSGVQVAEAFRIHL